MLEADDHVQLAHCGSPHGFRCELAAWTVVRLGLPELAELRQQPELRFPARITSQFLKNSDDQTVASLVGIFETIKILGQPASDFREWGVVSASRFVGRGAFAATLHKYGKNGPCGVSVQVVPNNLLHSVSSTISLALQCQGPCLGAGGGLNGEVDALLAAASLLADPQRLGVWVTWSYWDPELLIDEAGIPTSAAHCVVGALALRPLQSLATRAELEIRTNSNHRHRSPGISGFPELPSSGCSPEPRLALTNLANTLLDVSRVRARNFDVLSLLPGGLELEIRGRQLPPESSEPVALFGRQSLVAAYSG